MSKRSYQIVAFPYTKSDTLIILGHLDLRDLEKGVGVEAESLQRYAAMDWNTKTKAGLKRSILAMAQKDARESLAMWCDSDFERD